MLNSTSLLTSLRITSAAIDRSTERLASGKRIQTAADSPLEFSRLMDTKTSLSSIGMSLNTLENSMSKLEERDSSLVTMQESLMRFKELAMKASSGSALGTASLKDILPEMDAIEQTIASQANGKGIDGYMFAGTANSQPFVRDPMTQAMTYTGTTQDQSVTVQGVTLNNTVNGAPLLKVFDALKSSLDSVKAGTPVTTAQLSDLDDALSSLIQIRTTGAAQSAAAASVQTNLTGRQELYSDQVKQIESTDYAEESVRLSEKNAQYQATLQALSMELNRKRLMDFL
jgi:flagellin-like hook-associated protein FlgL